jgi:hypothetical protein
LLDPSDVGRRLAIHVISFIAALAVRQPMISAAAPKTPAQRASIQARWRSRADWKAWQSKVSGKAFIHLKSTSGGQVASVLFAKEAESKVDVVIRQPHDTTEAVRLHHASAKLAAELGQDSLLEPAARVIPRADQQGLARPGHSVMVTRRAAAGFRSAGEAPREWLARISEDQRLVGAFVDALSNQRDRAPKNLLINEHGQLRLIDQDSTFGRGPYWNQLTVFYPGNALGYASRQDSIDDLPIALRARVEKIAGATPEMLQRRYGLSPSESRCLLAAARLIKARGLTHAIADLHQGGKAFMDAAAAAAF